MQAVGPGCDLEDSEGQGRAATARGNAADCGWGSILVTLPRFFYPSHSASAFPRKSDSMGMRACVRTLFRLDLLAQVETQHTTSLASLEDAKVGTFDAISVRTLV